MEKNNDTTTLEAIRQGDRQAFDRLFRAYYQPLCHYAAGMTDGDRDAAEDIVQERFFKLWEKRETLKIDYSVKAYLYKMVHNACLNRIRGEKTRTKYKEQNAAYMEQNPVRVAEDAADVRDNIQKALATLPEQCRHVFELNRFEELKYREIADHLGISIKTVENHIGKALRLLRVQLADYIAVLILIFWAK